MSVRSGWSPSGACCRFDLNLECIGRMAESSNAAVKTGLAIESESSSGAANVGKVTEHVGEESTVGAGAASVIAGGLTTLSDLDIELR